MALPLLAAEPPTPHSLLDASAVSVSFSAANDAEPDGAGFRSTGPDPGVTALLPRPLAAKDTAIEIVARVATPHAGLSVAQLFAMSVALPEFTEGLSCKLTVAADGRWHRYLVPLAFAAPRNITALRLDPFDGEGTIELGRCLIGTVKPTDRDPSSHDFRAEAIDIDWLPGPGLAAAGGGRYEVRGPDAYLLSPEWVVVDAGRTTICEIKGASSLPGGKGSAPARLCFAHDSAAAQSGCVSVPPLTTAGTTHYVNMLFVPGWQGTIRRLTLEPFAGGAPAGSRVQIDWVKTVPLNAGPMTSFFARHADFLARHNPTRMIIMFLLGLGAALFLVTAAIERFAPDRGPEPARGPRALLEVLSVASLLAAIVLLAVFPFEAYPLLSGTFLHTRLDLPAALVIFSFVLGATRRILYGRASDAVSAIERPVAILVVVLALGSILAADRAMSLANLERYFLCYAAALLAGAWCPMGPRLFKTSLATVLAALGFVAAVGLVEAAGWKDFLYGAYFRAFTPLFYHANLRPKPFSTLGHYMALASYLLALMPIALYAAIRSEGPLKLLGRVVSALSFACILLTMSRGAYLAFAAALPFLWRLSAANRRRIVAAAAVIALLCGGLMVARRPRGRVAPFDTHGIQDNELGKPYIWNAAEAKSIFISQRILGIRIACGILARHPILGAGLGQFRALYDVFLPEGVHNRNPIWSTADDAYMTLLAEAGILGLGALLLLVAGLLRFFWLIATRRADGDDGPLAMAMMASSVGFFAHLLVYDGFYWYTAPLCAFTTMGLFSSALIEMGEVRRRGSAGACP